VAHYSEPWWFPTGQLATNQRAIVFGPGDQNTIATIYSDPGLTTPLDNPTVTDPTTAVLDFYVPDNSGTYWIFVGPVGTGDSVEWSSGGSADNPVLTVNGIAPDGAGNVEIDAADVDAIPNAIMDAKGDLIAATAADTPVRVGVGADGEVLTADSGAAAGVSWQPGGGGGGGIPESIIDAKGDLIAGSAPDTAVRVPVGTNGQYLRANSGAAPGVDWDTITASDVGAVPTSRVLTAGIALSGGGDLSADRTFDVDLGTTAGTAAAGNDTRIVNALQQTILDAKGDIIAATAADTPARVGVGSNGQVLTADSGAAPGVSWQTPAAAGIPPTILDAKGDLIAATAADTPARFPVGTNGQALRANSATSTGLEWDTLTASDVGAVPVDTAENIVYGTTTAGAPLNREISTIASPDTVAWRTSENQLRSDTVADGDPAADPDDLTNRAYVAAKVATGIPASIMDAKGDLIAATAADTPVRVAVGTDGQYLRANSAAAAGVDWDTITPGDIGAVPTSRVLTAGIALSGGGDLSADRTFDVDLGTTAGTAAEGNDTRIVNAIQGTLLDAKGDLIAASAADTPARFPVGTNGQALRANSATSTGLEWDTLDAADVGAIANALVDAKGDIITATAADTPARLPVGTDTFVLTANSAQATGLEWAAQSGIPATLLDAKGDIIAASAADTAARLAAGANGLVLTADSAQSTGLKWALSKTVGMYPRSTGFIPTGGVVTARSSKAATLNALFFIPFVTLVDGTLSVITWEATGNVGSAVVRLGIYAADSAGLPTGAAVADYGQTASDTTGVKTASVSTALAAGLWYLAFVGQVAAPTVRHCAGFSPYVASATFPSGTGLGWNNAWVQTGVSGTLPTVGSIVDSDSPLCGVKF
jgi:hypothetical protein